jgi:hypothetical protein
MLQWLQMRGSLRAPPGPWRSYVEGRDHYRTVTGMSERGQVKEQNFANGVIESANYDDSTGLALELLTSNLHEPKPAGCNPTLFARQVDYKYDQFLNVASQSKRFLQRDSNQQLMWQGCTPAESTSTESYQYGGRSHKACSVHSRCLLEPCYLTVWESAICSRRHSRQYGS